MRAELFEQQTELVKDSCTRPDRVNAFALLHACMQAAGWQVVCSGFPTARVTGLDATQHLPLLLVVSEDGWLRVWDWMRCTRLADRRLHGRQPLCCSLHPSGLLAAVGTTDTLAVFWVLKVQPECADC